MKKLSSGFKGFLVGVLFCLLVTTAYAANQIKAANYSNAKIYFYGQEVSITAQLAIIEETGADSTPKLYFPAELMEYMQFDIEWDKEKDAVNLTMNTDSGDYPYPLNPSALPGMNDTDKTSLDIIQRTGNWGYIESYLPQMSRAGIDAVVNCYNAKHQNPNEHKKAADYYQ